MRHQIKLYLISLYKTVKTHKIKYPGMMAGIQMHQLKYKISNKLRHINKQLKKAAEQNISIMIKDSKTIDTQEVKYYKILD